MNGLSESKNLENPEIWDAKRYADIKTARARTTIAWLPPDVRSVLDAGCGNGVLTNLLQDMDVSVGMDRSFAALRWVKAPGVQGDLGALPFVDGSFDAVVSTEVIEHLPVHLFAQGIAELVRVARCYVLISVPYYEDFEAFRITCPVCGCRFHRTYHMRRFDQNAMLSLFPPESGLRSIRLEGIFPVPTSRLDTLRHAVQETKRYLGVKKTNAGRPHAICSQCGYSRAASAGRRVTEQDHLR